MQPHRTTMTSVARASIVVTAPRAAVWDILVAPDTVKQIMPVAEVLRPWRGGEPFVWTFEMLGKPCRVAGVVHRMEVGHLLEYEYGDPHSRELLRLDNRHRVTIELADEGLDTRVTVLQDGNVDSAAHAHAEGGWRLALANLKAIAESAAP